MKKIKSASERTFSVAASRKALASRSKAAPSVARTFQPRPIWILARFGTVLESDRLPPLEREIAMFARDVCGLFG